MGVNVPYVGLGVKLNPSDDLLTRYKQETALDLVLNMYFSTSGEVYNSLLKKGIINQTFRFGVMQYDGALSVVLYGMTNKDEEFIKEIRKNLVGLKEELLT